MDDLLSEKEQLEQFRSWWKEYGYYVIGGIVIGAGLIIGYNQYQNAKLEAQLGASTAFEELVEYVADGKLEEAEAVADEISLSYAETTYVGQSGLAMARLYMDKNRDQDAADALLSVVDSDSTAELKHLARLRLARIYLYQEKFQDVLDLLSGEENGAFAATYSELLGDAYGGLGRVAEAEAAYQRALDDELGQTTLDRQLVQWKVLDLPAAEPLADVETAEPDAEEVVEAEDAVSEEGE